MFGPPGGTKAVPVGVDAPLHPVRVAQIADHQRQPLLRGDRGTAPHRQDEGCRAQTLGGMGVDLRVVGLLAGEPAQQLPQLFGEVVGVLLVAAQGPADPLGEADRAPEPHVDAAGEEGFQDPELLGDDERLVVGGWGASRRPCRP